MRTLTFDDWKLIVVPTDFSESEAIALPAAVQLARTFRVPIEVLHIDIDSALLLPPPAGAISVPVLFERTLFDSGGRLDKVVARTPGVGGHGLGRALLDGVAEKVVEYALCAVLVVPRLPTGPA